MKIVNLIFIFFSIFLIFIFITIILIRFLIYLYFGKFLSFLVLLLVYSFLCLSLSFNLLLLKFLYLLWCLLIMHSILEFFLMFRFYNWCIHISHYNWCMPLLLCCIAILSLKFIESHLIDLRLHIVSKNLLIFISVRIACRHLSYLRWLASSFHGNDNFSIEEFWDIVVCWNRFLSLHLICNIILLLELTLISITHEHFSIRSKMDSTYTIIERNDIVSHRTNKFALDLLLLNLSLKEDILLF